MPFMLLSDTKDVVRIGALGRISAHNAEAETDPLPTLAGAEGYARKVLLSLERVEFIDSAGIGWLLASHKRFKKAGGMLVLHSIPEQIMLTIKLLRLNSILNLAEDDAAASALAAGSELGR